MVLLFFEIFGFYIHKIKTLGVDPIIRLFEPFLRVFFKKGNVWSLCVGPNYFKIEHENFKNKRTMLHIVSLTGGSEKIKNFDAIYGSYDFSSYRGLCHH